MCFSYYNFLKDMEIYTSELVIDLLDNNIITADITNIITDIINTDDITDGVNNIAKQLSTFDTCKEFLDGVPKTIDIHEISGEIPACKKRKYFHNKLCESDNFSVSKFIYSCNDDYHFWKEIHISSGKISEKSIYFIKCDLVIKIDRFISSVLSKGDKITPYDIVKGYFYVYNNLFLKKRSTLEDFNSELRGLNFRKTLFIQNKFLKERKKKDKMSRLIFIPCDLIWPGCLDFYVCYKNGGSSFVKLFFVDNYHKLKEATSYCSFSGNVLFDIFHLFSSIFPFLSKKYDTINDFFSEPFLEYSYVKVRKEDDEYISFKFNEGIFHFSFNLNCFRDTFTQTSKKLKIRYEVINPSEVELSNTYKKNMFHITTSLAGKIISKGNTILKIKLDYENKDIFFKSDLEIKYVPP